MQEKPTSQVRRMREISCGLRMQMVDRDLGFLLWSPCLELSRRLRRVETQDNLTDLDDEHHSSADPEDKKEEAEASALDVPGVTREGSDLA